MSLALATVIAAALSAATATGATLWAKRKNGPDAALATVTASTLLMSQLQTRVAALETRVAHLEAENQAYHALFGPLPRG